MEKEKLIEAINSKGNSLISIWYNIGRALPFRAQRFPDGRISDWYKNQFVEVHSVKPGGKGGKYGSAYGFYYRNGERADAYENSESSWCKIDDIEPKEMTKPKGSANTSVSANIRKVCSSPRTSSSVTSQKPIFLNPLLQYYKFE